MSYDTTNAKEELERILTKVPHLTVLCAKIEYGPGWQEEDQKIFKP